MNFPFCFQTSRSMTLTTTVLSPFAVRFDSTVLQLLTTWQKKWCKSEFNIS